MTTPFCESGACTLSDASHLKGECEPWAFKRAVMVGRKHLWEGAARTSAIWVEIRFEHCNGGWELSICAVEGPKRNGDADGSCGQARGSLVGLETYGEGWDQEMVTRLGEIWDAWHLNRMQAGSLAQQAHLETLKFPGYPTSHYDWAKEQLAAVGLQPDPNYIHNDKPYSYGSAWLSIEVPDDVVAWLRELPAGTTAEFPWTL